MNTLLHIYVRTRGEASIYVRERGRYPVFTCSPGRGPGEASNDRAGEGVVSAATIRLADDQLAQQSHSARCGVHLVCAGRCVRNEAARARDARKSLAQIGRSGSITAMQPAKADI